MHCPMNSNVHEGMLFSIDQDLRQYRQVRREGFCRVANWSVIAIAIVIIVTVCEFNDLQVLNSSLRPQAIVFLHYAFDDSADVGIINQRVVFH